MSSPDCSDNVHLQDLAVLCHNLSWLLWKLNGFLCWCHCLFIISESHFSSHDFSTVVIPENGHPHLKFMHNHTGYIVRDQQGFPEGTKVSCLTAITGLTSFHTGEHYWEVSVGDDQAGLKQSWWLGVTNVSNIPDDAEFSPAASKGFWFLSSSPENPDFFQLNTEPASLLPVGSRPQTVGVYLNCDRGEVTFYNVEKSSIIGSLKGDFKGDVFPLFNPGLFDAAPLKILHKNITEPCGSNNEQSVAVDPEKQQLHH